jgi:hypothetical protein
LKQYNAAWNNNGELVGLKIRFTDRISLPKSIKLCLLGFDAFLFFVNKSTFCNLLSFKVITKINSFIGKYTFL